jgi:ribbon-helix-helix CopG family protein
MTKRRTYGHTKSGQPIADEDIQKLAAEAEAGYDVEQVIARRNKRGRPTIGNAPSSVESVRLDPALRRQLLQRAEADGTTPSELIREALRRYFEAA